MKSFFKKTIAVNQRLGIDFQGHTRTAEINAKLGDILSCLSVLEIPDRLANYESKMASAAEDTQQQPEHLVDKTLRLLKTFDNGVLNYIRDNLESLISQHKFQDFVRSMISNDFTAEQSDVRTALRELFYEIFSGREKDFTAMCNLMGISNENEVRQRGTLLIKIRYLGAVTHHGIQVYEEVDHDNEFTSNELKAIFEVLCNISYSNPSLLFAVRRIVKCPNLDNPKKEPNIASYRKDSRSIVIVKYEDMDSLVSLVVHGIGRGIWEQKDLFWGYKSRKRFIWLHRISVLFSGMFSSIKGSLGSVKEDFALLFLYSHLSESHKENLKRAAQKRFGGLLLRLKIRHLQALHFIRPII